MNVSDARPRRYRGRLLAPTQLQVLRHCVASHFQQGRSRIARALCEHWQWRQPNGQFKEFAARALLLHLERQDLITLPARRRPKVNRPRPRAPALPPLDRVPLPASGGARGALVVRPAHEPAERALWEALLAEFHYLGYARVVGEQVRHLAWVGLRPVAVLAWASAAFQVGCRDEFIGWDAATRQRQLFLLANNVRLVVLPWAQRPHLASAVLARSARRLSADWLQRYGHPVVLAETFVDPTRFAGTVYRAANWRRVGTSRGSAKRGDTYAAHQQPKTVWVYPLHRHWRRLLGA